MADTEAVVADSASKTEQNQDEILQAAQNEISQVMATAMGNLSDQTKGEEPSEFLNKHLSNETVAVEDPDYVEPMQDPYNKAITYLENHNILQLFQTLTAGIVYHKPEKPLEYMMLEVEKMKKEKATTK